MRVFKSFYGATAACLLAFGSAQAQAQGGVGGEPNTCEDGVITGEVNQDVLVENRSCVIQEAVINGRVDVSNAQTVYSA